MPVKEIQHATKKTSSVVELPNMVELQLDSYRWFLEEGLKELFDSFSPIYDFTGNTSISLVDFTLGEPKYTVEECRDRDMTFESPIKAKVRLTQANKEMIESEVYLGDLPLMTDKGTFVINGAERVVVSQLARSPGVYFKDNLDFSGRVLYYATIIPSEGAWVDVETDASDAVTVRIGQTRKFPLTTLLRALNAFPTACIPVEMKIADVQEKLWIYRNVEAELSLQSTRDYILPMALAESVVEKKTGEILFEAGARIVATRGDREREESYKSGDRFVSLEEMAEKLNPNYVIKLQSPCDSTGDIVKLFSTRVTLESPTAKDLIGKRAADDIMDAKGEKTILKAFHKIDKTTATAVAKMEPARLDVYVCHRYVEATLEQDDANNMPEALLSIYRKIRPGDPATPDSSRNLLQSIFYDSRRYDLAKVGRFKLNKKLGADLPLSARTLTRED